MSNGVDPRHIQLLSKFQTADREFAIEFVRFADLGGPLLTECHLHLVFWGDDWKTATDPALTDVYASLQKLLAGTYMLGLSQYRGIQPAVIQGGDLIAGGFAEGKFTLYDVGTMLTNCFQQGRLPDPRQDNQMLYMVLTAPGARFDAAAGIAAEHTFGAYGGTFFPFAVVPYFSTLNILMSYACHELVESCTNPISAGIVWEYSPPNEGEIADVCSAGELVDGVSVWPYWSIRDRRCIVSKRVAQIRIIGQAGCDVGPVRGETSVFEAQIKADPAWIDISLVPPQPNPKYAWQILGIAGGGLSNGPTYTVQWNPDAMTPVTVSVSISGDDGSVISGSRTFIALSPESASLLRGFCTLRRRINTGFLFSNSPGTPVNYEMLLASNSLSSDLRQLAEEMRNVADQLDQLRINTAPK